MDFVSSPVTSSTPQDARRAPSPESYRSVSPPAGKNLSEISDDGSSTIDNDCSSAEEVHALKGRFSGASSPGASTKSLLSGGSDETTSSARPQPRRLRWLCIGTLIGELIIILLLISLLIYYTIHLRSLIPHNDIERIIASWGQPGSASQNAKPPYPSNLTLGITPIPCHSHNDYTRHVPLYDALAAGCTGVEADVWLQSNGDLFVGHTKNSLSNTRTLQSLYIDPLVSILSLENPSMGDTAPATSNNTFPLQGIFDASPQTSLTLLIDVKTSGASTFPAVLSALEPLRSKGLLTYYNGSHLVPGPITVVATGNTPFSSILALAHDHRDVFFDAPLDELSGEDAPANGTLYDHTNSYYASVSFPKAIGKPYRGIFSPAQVDVIQRQLKGAKDRGLKARYWDTPAWPVGLRDHVWNVLVNEGVGLLNVDDLEAASQQDWGS